MTESDSEIYFPEAETDEYAFGNKGERVIIGRSIEALRIAAKFYGTITSSALVTLRSYNYKI